MPPLLQEIKTFKQVPIGEFFLDDAGHPWRKLMEASGVRISTYSAPQTAVLMTAVGTSTIGMFGHFQEHSVVQYPLSPDAQFKLREGALKYLVDLSEKLGFGPVNQPQETS